MFVITNNPMVVEESKVEVVKIEKDYIGVLKECRDYIHTGYKLLSHPLYGSVKPNETPYRTIILKKENTLDMDSLFLIEEAISTASKFANNFKTPNWTDGVLDDFQVLDYDIFENTVSRIVYI